MQLMLLQQLFTPASQHELAPHYAPEMKFNPTPVLVFLLLISLPSLLFSQPGQRGGGITVRGEIINPDTQSPLSYATVSFYRTADSTLADGGLTDESGQFRVQLQAGDYFAEVQYIGFATKNLPAFTLAEGQGSLNLGTIELTEDAVNLNEVEVTAERSQMQLQLDKRVFNVGKDLTNAGSNAADILDNVPSVTVDIDGNVSLRGSQNVRILIDGKPSGLVGLGDAMALQRMRGDIIESIEVITNPSARYEAEGEAGIINIILKKEKQKGVNGSFGLTTGYPDNYGASYSLNFRREKINFFSNFGLTYRKAPGGGNSFQQFFDNGVLTDFYTTERDQSRGGLGGNLQMGADFYLSPRSTITASGLYRLSEGANDSRVRYRDFDADGDLLATSIRSTDETEDEQNYEGSLNYTLSFDNPDQKWTIDLKYISDEEREVADYRETGEDFENGLLIQRSDITENETNFLFQTDYIQPIGENGKLEAGLRAAVRQIENEFLLEEQDGSGAFGVVPGFNDRLLYDESVYAAYAIGAQEFGRFGVQVGLRMEYSDIEARLTGSGEESLQDYLNLFPSAFLSYRVNEQNQLQASYSRRISRPWFRLLLPFSNFGDRRNNYVGNPNLRPEFSDAFELGYLTYLGKGSLLSSVYYRKTTGVIERVTIPGEDATTLRFPINLAERDAYGLEFNLSYDFAKWWRNNLNLNFFREIIDGEYEGRILSSDTYSWNSRLNSKLTLWKEYDAQVSFNYRAPRQDPQGRDLAVYSLDLGMSRDVFKGNGTLTLSVRDLLNSRKRRSITDLEDFYAESEFQWRSRQLTLTFNYRLNQKKGRGDRGRDRGEGGGDYDGGDEGF